MRQFLLFLVSGVDLIEVIWPELLKLEEVLEYQPLQPGFGVLTCTSRDEESASGRSDEQLLEVLGKVNGVERAAKCGSVVLGKPRRFAPDRSELFKKLDMQLENSDLSVRVLGVLHRAGFRYIGQLVKMTPNDLLLVENFGHGSYHEVSMYLETLGLRLGMGDDPGVKAWDVLAAS